MPEKHLSSQFDSELNSVSSRVRELGGRVDSAHGGHRSSCAQGFAKPADLPARNPQ